MQKSPNCLQTYANDSGIFLGISAKKGDFAPQVFARNDSVKT
jgi:hypothetical protein